MELEDNFLDETHQVNWEDLEVDDQPLDDTKDYGSVFNGCWFGRVCEFPDTVSVTHILGSEGAVVSEFRKRRRSRRSNEISKKRIENSFVSQSFIYISY